MRNELIEVDVPTILIAPNAFKHGLGATAVAEAVKAGFLASKLACHCICFPIGDGGNGTGTLIARRLGLQRHSTVVSGPLGKPVESFFYSTKDGTMAVVEMAEASGLHLVAKGELNPLIATTFGTGELIVDALNRGAEEVVLCVGGSATVDAGIGLLSALGFTFRNSQCEVVDAIPANLHLIETIASKAIHPGLGKCKIRVLCDVTNPVVGESGAAVVFGPQKGASPEEVLVLENNLLSATSLFSAYCGKDIADMAMGGAAGGLAAGLHAVLGAELVDGISHFLALTGFDDVLRKADLLITGEGSIDGQTMGGKGPYGVALRAKQVGIPVVALAGKIHSRAEVDYSRAFDVLLAIGNGECSLQEALESTYDNLRYVATQLGNSMAFLPAQRHRRSEYLPKNSST